MSTSRSPAGVVPPPPFSQDRGYGPSNHFPQQQHGMEQGYPTAAADAETLSNTIANSHVEHDNHLDGPIAPRPTKFTEEWDVSQRGSSIIDGQRYSKTSNHINNSAMQRSSSYAGSVAGITNDGATSLSRGNTLKKKASIRRSGSLKRSNSRRSMKAGSVRSLALQPTTDQDELHSAFYCPVPTSGSPTEVLANRFQAWRKILKDLITYFREIQAHYEHRAKSLIKLGNVLNNITTPPGFIASGGLDDALQILRGHNKQAIMEANKAREIEEDVILALTGLRSDLHQKIKEIKNLSGDFKNSVDKEMEATRKAVNNLQDVLGQTELDTALTTGKQDPYLLRLNVDRQLEKQIDEENYLHQAYLNLENSGKELESIVVGEIQKSYNAYASILKREADSAYGAIEELRLGPITLAKDAEWLSFVHRDERFVDPDLPMRSAEFIHYPGRDHYACQEIRAGLLERKSKYLKSYTAGWYVLSPTHLHEFKSADKTQAPVMSLYLPEQKLGSHSTEGGSSNKFVLKGRQTGSMHRGHTWVFRAESHDTMMAWYEDIKTLTERTPEERSNLVRGNSRSISRSSQRSSLSSDGVDDDEDPPFMATAASVNQQPRPDSLPRRPSGGRFPSDLQVNAQRGLQVPLSPLSISSEPNRYDENDRDVIVAANTIPRSELGPQYHIHQHFDTSSTTRRNEDLRSPPIPQTRTTTGAYEEPNGRVVGSANNQVYTNGGSDSYQKDGMVWAEPVPISPSTLRDQAQTLSSRADADDRLYATQNISVTDGQDGYKSEPRGNWYGQANGGIAQNDPQVRPGAERTDSAPTISHLHIPGEYPKSSTSGF
ncbi:phosphatidylinositol 4,5-bisphosphate-binding protein [Podospora pseudopauciseta]|uniref:Phosphatidylinositol 4,5-bisphosphate-binding protein n=1 Tax=Podospora pseudopauciseta TaxID=2093780 RepID=A0ABR0H933_9PEZI|nr:phosphatidylinositol 4,5-bisphosphate-binding protein [Podospora pseudopauciseta]